jgi:hypothetical protein
MVRRPMLPLVALFALSAADPEELSCPAQAADKAHAAFESGDVAGTLAATQNVERCTDGTAAELARALRWRAQAVAAKGNEVATVTAFAWVYAVDPRFVPEPPLPMDLEALFERGKAQAQSDQLVLVRLLAPATDAGGTFVRAEVLGVGTPSRVDAIFREKTTVAASPERAGVYRAKVPVGRAVAYRFRAVVGGFEFTSLSGEAPAVVAPTVPAVDGAVSAVSGETARPSGSRRSRVPWLIMGGAGVLGIGGIIELLVGNGLLLPIAQGDFTINSLAQLDGRIAVATTLQYTGVAALCIAGAAVIASAIWVAYDNRRLANERAAR